MGTSSSGAEESRGSRHPKTVSLNPISIWRISIRPFRLFHGDAQVERHHDLHRQLRTPVDAEHDERYLLALRPLVGQRPLDAAPVHVQPLTPQGADVFTQTL